MPRIIKISLWALAVPTMLLAGIFLYLRNADLRTFETQIEAALSKAIEHDVQIEGFFNLRFGSLAKVTAEEIYVTNTEWPQDSQLLSIGHLSVTVDIWSLFSSPIIIEDFELHDAQIIVEKNADDVSNWQPNSSDNSSATSGDFDVNLIAFKEVRLQNVSLVYDQPDREAPLRINLEQLTINPDSTDVLDLELQGTVNDYTLSGDGKIGPWQRLIDGRDLTADFDLSLGQVKLDLNGSIADLNRLEGLQMDISVQGPAIERVTDVFGLPPFASGPFQIDADAQKSNAANQVQLSGNLGDIDITTTGEIDNFLAPKTANLAVSISGPDMRHVAEVFGIYGAPEVPFQTFGDFVMNESRFEFSNASAQLGENQLSLDGWIDLDKSIPDGDITVSASGPNLAVIDPFIDLHGIPGWNFDVQGRIQKLHRRVHFQDFSANLGPNVIEANGAIDPQNDETEIFVSISGPDISFIQSLAELPDVPAKPFSLSAFLRPDPIGINLDEAQLIVGDNQLDVDGIVSTIDRANGTKISLHGFGPELLNVSLLTGIPYMPAGVYDYTGNISIDGETLTLGNFDLSVVGATASASGTVDIGARAGDFDLELTASSDDVSQLELFDSLKQLNGEALNLSGNVEHRSGRFELTSVSADIGNFDIRADGVFDSANSVASLSVGVNAPDAGLLDRFLNGRTFPGGPLAMQGQVVRSPENIEFTDASFQVGDFSVLIDGTLNNSPLSNSSDLDFSVAGASLHTLGQMFGINTFPPKSFSFAGEVNGIPTGFAIENIDANVGENDIFGRFTADLQNKPRVTGSLTASYLDIANQLAIAAENRASSEAETSSGPFVLPEEPLPLTWMNEFDASVQFRADRVLFTQLDVHDFDIGIEIEDGSLKADPISLGESNGEISGYLHITPEDDAFELTTAIEIENIHVGMVESTGAVRTALPVVNGNIKLTGYGNSIHEIMAGSNGEISLYQGAGRTSSVFVSRLFGDLVTQILQAVNPLHKSQRYTSLECAFYEIAINDGLATLNNLVMQTDKVTMAAEGTVNFADEALKLSVSAKPRKGFGISVGGIANSFLNVRGTLKEPTLGIDATGTVTTAGAAVATGGLSLIATGLWNRVNAEKSICDPSK